MWKGECSFAVDFCSLSLSLANPKHCEAPTWLVVAWGALGLGYEAMELVFVMSGGVPPISKRQSALAMKNLVCLVLSYVFLVY
jgi:hypothetical protein